MARKHSTSSSSKNDDSTHHTKHSYEGTTEPGIRRSYDRNSDGSKSNDHITDQNTGETYYVQDSGSKKAGDLTDKKGNILRHSSIGLPDWLK
jgi:hypothetical protein